MQCTGVSFGSKAIFDLVPSRRLPEPKHTSTAIKAVTQRPAAVEKKLSPMEKLKLKMRTAFDDQSRKY